MTLIGTPPNILASEILERSTVTYRFAFFDFLPMGIIILISGTLYMILVGRHLLPSSKTEGSLTENYELREYVTEIKILPNSPLVGKTLIASRLGEEHDITIINKILPKSSESAGSSSIDWQPVGRNTIINENDVYLVQGKLEDIFRIQTDQNIELKTDLTLQDNTLSSTEASIAEAVVTSRSDLVGRTLRQSHFRERYALNVLAIWRDEHPLHQQLADIELHFGDVLLLQGRRDRLQLSNNNPGLLLLQDVPYQTRRSDKIVFALAILGAMLLAVTAGWLHISIAAVMAAVAMVLTGVLTMDEAYQAIQWRSIFLIAGMLPLGIAMEQSGTAQFLANNIVALTGWWGPIGVLVGIYLLTLLITQPMSNAAATVLIAPIAINVANTLAIDPRPLIMAVVIAASTAFLTPIGHQANVLVYGVGGYKFTDFTKVGLGLNLLYLTIVIILLPLIWPFH